MNEVQAIILGIVEGITEFLPISSTFHLIWTATLLGIEQTESQKLFEVAIQSGAILAVGTLFAKTAWQNPALVKKVFVAFIPTAIIGFLLYNIIKNIFLESATLQLGVFIAVGIVFVLFEHFSKKSYARTLSSITYREALMVGMAQALAVVPGVSRAGAVILALMALNMRRSEAATFSFMLAVPTIGAATIFDIAKSREVLGTPHDILLLTIGFATAFVTALIVVRWLVTYLQTHTLAIFGWYRIAMGILLILLLGA